MGVGELLSLLCFVFYYCVREVVYFVLRNRPRKDIKGEHVLVTGSAQGIGAVFALKFAEMGNTVHCVDVCEELNQATVQSLLDKGYAAFAYSCDLTKPESIERLGREVKENGTVTYVVNNAGVAIGKRLTDLTGNQIAYVLQVNLLAQLLVVKQFLPEMLALDHGHVINIASLAGMIPVNSLVDYCTSKAGSVMFSEALAMELTGTNVSCTVVCPYFVNTNMIRGIEDQIDGVIEPEYLVEMAIKGVREGKGKVVVPRTPFFFLALIKDLIPGQVKERLRRLKSEKYSENYVGQNTAGKIK